MMAGLLADSGGGSGESPALPLHQFHRQLSEPSEAMLASVMDDEDKKEDAIVVRLRHRLFGNELLVTVPPGAKMFDVRREAARRLGNESILTHGRLVKPGPGQKILYGDEELLGKRRRLLFIGPPLKGSPGAAASPSGGGSSGATPTGAAAAAEAEGGDSRRERRMSSWSESEVAHVESGISDFASVAAVTPTEADFGPQTGGSSPFAGDGARAPAAAGRTPALQPPLEPPAEAPDPAASAPPANGEASAAATPAALSVGAVRGPAPAAAARLTRRRAFGALMDTHVALLDTKIQRKLKQLAEDDGGAAAGDGASTAAAQAQRLGELVLSAQATVLPKYGFEASAREAAALLREIRAFCDADEEVADGWQTVNARLGLGAKPGGPDLLQLALNALEEASSTAQAKETGREEDGDLVQVRLRHKIDGEELYVSVPRTATMSDVLAAAGAKLESDAVRARGRLVKPGVNGAVFPYDNREALGSRRRLLFMGAELRPSRPPPPASPTSPTSPPPTAPAAPRTPGGAGAGAGGGAEGGQREEAADAQPKASEGQAKEQDVQVVIRHVTSGEEVLIILPTTATAGSILEAVALRLGRPVIRRDGQLLAPAPFCGYSLLGHAATLGSNRVLFIDGVESLKANPNHCSAQEQAAGASSDLTLPGLDRSVLVKLEHSDEQVSISMSKEATVADLKQRLEEDYGIPTRAPVMARTPTGLLEPLAGGGAGAGAASGDGGRKLPRAVVLKGVASFEDGPPPITALLEDDMLQAVAQLNKRFEKAEFQEQVRWWKEAPTTEATSRFQEFRKGVTRIIADVLPKYGFEKSAEGLKTWEKAIERFLHFPAFAEICRKSRVLMGTLSPEQARQQQRASMSKKAVGSRSQVSKHQVQLAVREILSEQALINSRRDAEGIFDLLYRRIYEENRDSLWEGGRVRGREMPTRKAIAKKYLAPPGTMLLRCSTGTSTKEQLVGGAVVFPVEVVGLRRPAGAGDHEWEEFVTTPPSQSSQGDPKRRPSWSGQRYGRDNSDEDDEEMPTAVLAAGYIEALAAEPGSHAGTALVTHLEGLATAEGWDLLALHSVHVKDTINFWSRRGFHSFGRGRETQFQVACWKECGYFVAKETLEQSLPRRPGCTLFVKFCSPATRR